jgi:hypothetical protein
MTGPESTEFTVEVAAGAWSWTWAGYADNPVDALERAVTTLEDEAYQAEGADPGAGE